jgi:hypothetical protein
VARGKRVEIWRVRRQTRSMPDKAHPCHGNCVVILMRGSVMLRKGLNSPHHVRECLFLRKLLRIDPRQADMFTYYIGQAGRANEKTANSPA